MPRVSFAFFIAAVLYGLTGMSLGIVMGATQTFTLMPVHAHINLLGWVSLAIMGGFYALAGERAPKRLAWVNFAVSNVGLLVCAPSLALLLLGDKSVIPFLSASEFTLVAGMLIFAAAIVLTAARSAPAPAAARLRTA
jgi:cbb3-type cytochrome oxidase subunit 1